MDQSNPKNYVQSELTYFEDIEGYFMSSSGSFTEKVHAFARYVPRQAISYFLARNEIFKEIVSLHGSILDFGIYRGSSYFTWQQLSSIYEPYNHIRKIIGFDSFEGFSSVERQDYGTDGRELSIKRAGGMKFEDGQSELQRGINLMDLNRPLGHVRKAEIVQGTLPGALANYLDQHKETTIALGNFGLGLYSPTLEILKLIKPRLQAGSILVFEDLNQATWPGETQALYEVFSPAEITLNRVPYCPHISWMKVGGNRAVT